MCDGCGCDRPGAPGSSATPARRKAGDWHVHADGTVHRHDEAHTHVYHPVSRGAGKPPSGTGPAPQGNTETPDATR